MQKLTRAESKERTRQRLIEAAIDVLRAEGLQGMSTRKLARMAGLSQPSFYVHFDDMDALITAAGEQMAGRIREQLRRLHEVQAGGVDHPRPLGLAEVVSTRPAFLELLMKYRRDDTSALGRVAAGFFEGLRRDLRDELERMGAHPDRLPDMDVFVDIVGGLAMAVLEGVVDGRYRDDDEALRAIAVASRGAFRALHAEHAARRAPSRLPGREQEARPRRPH